MSTTIRPSCQHVPYPGNRFPHSCLKCGAYIKEWK